MPEFKEPTINDVKITGKIYLGYTIFSFLACIFFMVFFKDRAAIESIVLISVIGIIAGIVAYVVFKKASKMEKGGMNEK